MSAINFALVGSVSAFFLISLDWVTDWRESHIWIIAFLPIGGLIIGLTYHYLGSSVVGGNNQLLDEFHSPKKIIPFRMAPLRSLIEQKAQTSLYIFNITYILLILFICMKKNSRFLKILGFIILAIACSLFLLIPVVPFLNFTTKQIAGITTGLFIAGEVLFYLSLFILGRSFYDKIKKKFRFWRSSKN